MTELSAPASPDAPDAPVESGRADRARGGTRIRAVAARARRGAGGVDRPVAAALVGAFVVTRLGYYAMGVRYDASLLKVALQYLEVEDLQHRLGESLWYLHTQPPLFNGLIGIVLKVSPVAPGHTFHALWLACGLALVAVVYLLLRRLGVPRWWGVAATIVICCSPTVVLYENWLYYEYPLTLAITAIALAAAHWATGGRLASLATVALLLGACVLTRSLLNPLWYVGVIALVLLARRPTGQWGRALLIVAAPLVLIGLIIVKNQVLFQSPSLSSWSGWNLQRVTVDELPDDVKQRLIADGTLTPLATYPVFLPTDKYAAVVAPCTPAHPDVAVLADPTKPSSGFENWNNECYLPITREALHNALAAARAEPRATGRAVVGSFQIWAESSSQYAFVYDNRLKIDAIDQPYRQLILVDIPWNPPVKTNAGWWIPIGTPGGRWRFSLTIVVLTIASVVAGLAALWHLLRRRTPSAGAAADDRGEQDPTGAAAVRGTDAAVAVIGFTVLMVTVVGNIFEIGENNRFRFMVEPITLVIGVWLLTRLIRAIATRRSRPGAGASADGSADGPGDRDPAVAALVEDVPVAVE